MMGSSNLLLAITALVGTVFLMFIVRLLADLWGWVEARLTPRRRSRRIMQNRVNLRVKVGGVNDRK